MSNVLKVENEETILFASKIVWSEGRAPLRVVLRKKGEEFITHMESLRLEDGVFKHDDFFWGHYFMLDSKAAQDDYNKRCTKI